MAQGRQSGLQRPVTPSKELAAITGSDPLPRSQVVSKVWDHIRKNNLQNPSNKREIAFQGDCIGRACARPARLSPSQLPRRRWPS